MNTRSLLDGPYPGLRPFRKSEWPIFFGREPMIDAVLDRLAATQLVFVHGSSGCGKSSLIRAGVLPRLEQEYCRHGVPWRTAEMRPGSSPMWNLAMAIARLVEKLDNDGEPTLETTRTIRRLLNSGSEALGRVEERFELGKNGNICILLDQFEELFRYAREIGREEAEALVQVLKGFERRPDGAGLGPPKGVYAIVTMRSDHLGDCGHIQGFAELVNATQYLLPQISDQDLLRAIREPARLFGGEVAVDLAVRLIKESGDEFDALPLVQHALMRMWRQAGGGAGEAFRERANSDSAPSPILTSDDFNGLEELLSQHAEEILSDVSAGNPRNEKVTEYLFRAITEIDVEGRGIRRPQRFSHLIGATGGNEVALVRVIDRFSKPDCGFIVRSPGEDPIIDIGHEALIRCWRKLDDPTLDRATGRPSGWVQREQEDGRTWRGLLFQAEAGERISAAVLKDREDWFETLAGPAWAERHEGGYDKIGRLLESSRNKVRRGRLMKMGVALGSIAFVLLAAAVVSWWSVGVNPEDGLKLFRLRAGFLNPAPAMVEIPAGSFMMGAPESETMGGDQERPQHEVSVPAFAIGKHEVTFDDWDLCVLDKGCIARPGEQNVEHGQLPVNDVSWDDATTYVQWLSKVTGDVYRLPSEAEWEYAARAGTTTPFSTGTTITTDQANFDGSEYRAKTIPVGKLARNDWGVYDVHGNVSEWVADCWHDSYEVNGVPAPTDGSAWQSTPCEYRVARGGSLDSISDEVRSARRQKAKPTARLNSRGFRIARTLPG